MKKILGIVVLGLLLSGNAYAGILINNCKTVYPAGHFSSNPNSEKISELGGKKEYYISYEDGLIYYTAVTSNFTLEILEKAEEEGVPTPPKSKVNNYNYKIQFVDEDEIIAIRIQEYNVPTFNHYEEITINLKTNRVSKRVFADTPGGKEMIKTAKMAIKNYPLNDVCEKEKLAESSKGSSGTAFFINKKGYLLTNNHVVDGCTLSKISYKNKDYDTKLIATDKTLDLALLKAELKPKTFINFSKDEAKKLDTIYVAGYPLGKGLSDDLKINPGSVSSLKGFEDNSNEIQIDAPINPGNSGGPIINENGNLIAIAVSGMAKDQTEGINFGIKSSAAERFLKSNNININKSFYSRSKNKEQLRNILEEGTVYTYCN